jgi:hypothetical protein
LQSFKRITISVEERKSKRKISALGEAVQVGTPRNKMGQIRTKEDCAAQAVLICARPFQGLKKRAGGRNHLRVT